MQYTPNLSNIEPALTSIFKQYSLIKDIVKALHAYGAHVYLVGGAVRDIVLGMATHDLDIEVHDISLEDMQTLLSKFGPVSLVGKSFGVFKLPSYPVDWALPRTDTSGRKPQVSINPKMGIIEALRRRDLTMNAMAIDLKSHEFIDPFHGLEDIKKQILRSPDIHFFSEDPLRFYRVMQFIGRFEMLPDETLQEKCAMMDISQVSLERIEDEFEKLILRSKRPAFGIRWLVIVNRLTEILPEVAHTQATEQDPEWHPEGNVFEHLMQSLDAAALLTYDSSDEKLTICYAALCHDLGKVSTTIFKDGHVRSPGHAEVGVPLTRSLLRRITRKNKIIDAAAVLVKHHMQPGQFIQLHSTLAAYRRLALNINKYANISMLVKLALADARGRNPQSHEPLTLTPHFLKAFVKKAEEAQALLSVEAPVLQGRDIADLVPPGPEMGRFVKHAYAVQLDEGIRDKEVLKDRVVKLLNEEKKSRV